MTRAWLYLLLGIFLFPNATAAQIGGASERGEYLGSLVNSLSGVTSPSIAEELPCLDIWSRNPDIVGFECLLSRIGVSFQIPEQADLILQIFDSRFAVRRTWPILQRALVEEFDVLIDKANDGQLGLGGVVDQRTTFSDLRFSDACPVIVNFDPFLPGDIRVQWLATPEGFRDLSPPRVMRESADRALLREGLLSSDPAGVLTQMPCEELRVPLARTLIRSALAFGDIELAQALAALPFMPRRYQRQTVGATQDGASMLQLTLDASDAVLEGQFSLDDPSAIEAEVAVLLNEIDRQFAIDFLLGRLWSLSLEELQALEFDDTFVAEVARLLSQDARLLQQSYDSSEVRFFYPDFFDVLVDKKAFDLLMGLDLLVPAVIRSEFQLALSAEPLSATSPTRFELDQEALALLIRLQEVASVLNVWPDLSSPQRQDAVLYALDQGAWDTGGVLYNALSTEEVSADFLIRLALYYADAIDGDSDVDDGVEINLEVEEGA